MKTRQRLKDDDRQHFPQERMGSARLQEGFAKGSLLVWDAVLQEEAPPQTSR